MKSYKHKDSRLHIPSSEEAGYEAANPVVQDGPAHTGLPLNPVIHRGDDPELFWKSKYPADAAIAGILEKYQKRNAASASKEEMLRDLQTLYEAVSEPQEHPEYAERLLVDIRSLYRHEHISPEMLMRALYRYVELKPDAAQLDLFSVNDLFGNSFSHDELDKIPAYYRQPDGWSNRLIQGDSLLVMASLLEREGMAGKVQTIYFDPPYGIKYGGNWQMKLNDRDVKDGADEHLSAEPEQIKAFRDTWELGIHSYLGYLRERLLVARELLSESGSCFVQISDENVHLVRCLMDEVFGSGNFVSQINFKSMMPLESGNIESVFDYVVWYSRNKEQMKYRNLYISKQVGLGSEFVFCDDERGGYRKLTREEIENFNESAKRLKIFKRSDLASSGYTPSCIFPIEFEGKTFSTTSGKSWRTNRNGIEKLIQKKRLFTLGVKLYYKMYLDDFPYTSMINSWQDTIESAKRDYVVQTTKTVIQRCLLMTTDPGDLVLDPTCGSGTAAYVAEQWGRRWITIDTSRIAVNIAKTRLMTAVFPYYQLYDQQGEDIRQGFVYKKVPHITLKALANDEPFDEETLYDQPFEDKKKIRVAGPFTVETLQSFEPLPPEALDAPAAQNEEAEAFEARIFEHLKSAGVKNGIRNEQAIFIRIDRLGSGSLHAEGFYRTDAGERKAYIHIGPKFGTVSRQAVNDAVKECRLLGDADWLIILGFSFESNIENRSVTTSAGSFEVSKVRMHDDLLQDGLRKKPAKSAASFVTIGEPDVQLTVGSEAIGEAMATVEILGLDIYDPIKDEVKERSVADIAYWMLDDDYDGSNFVVKQVFFCGGGRDEFEKWRKGLDSLSKSNAKKQAEYTLGIEIDEEAFDRLYGHTSHPFPVRPGQRIAVRVISQFGEESTKVMGV